MQLEAVACRKAISLAEVPLLQNFVIASDSKQVVGDILKENQGGYGIIIREIQHHSSMFSCNFIFKSHESNYEAHSLAKFSHSLGQGRHVWLG